MKVLFNEVVFNEVVFNEVVFNEVVFNEVVFSDDVLGIIMDSVFTFVINTFSEFFTPFYTIFNLLNNNLLIS